MKKLLLLALTVALFSGCSSVSVKRDFDPTVSFSPLKTFAWQHAEQPETGDPRIDNDLSDQRIRNAIKATLESKGFHAVDRAEADFLVAYFVDHQRRQSSSSVSVGMGRGSYGRHGGVGYSTGVSEYDQAILTIDMIDSTHEKMIWRGVGSRAAYSGSNPEQLVKRTNESVAAILKKFPPK